MFGRPSDCQETNIEIDVEKDVDVFVNVDFDPSSDLYSEADVNWDFDVSNCVDGNSAVFNVEVDAIGEDTAVELNLFVLTNDDTSMITASGFSHTA